MFRAKEVRTEDFDDHHHHQAKKPIDRAVQSDKAQQHVDSFHASDLHHKPSITSYPLYTPPGESAVPQSSQKHETKLTKKSHPTLFDAGREKVVDFNKRHTYENSHHASERPPKSLVGLLPMDEDRVARENLQRQQRIIDEERKNHWTAIMKNGFSNKTDYHPNAANIVQLQHPTEVCAPYVHDYPALQHYYEVQTHAPTHDPMDHTPPSFAEKISKAWDNITSQKHPSSKHWHDEHQRWQQHQDVNQTPTAHFDHRFGEIKKLLLLTPVAYDEVKNITADQYDHYKDVFRERFHDGKVLLKQLKDELDSTSFEDIRDKVQDVTEDKFDEWKHSMYDNLSNLVHETNTQQRELASWLKEHHLRPKDVMKAGKEMAADVKDYIQEVREDPKQILDDGGKMLHKAQDKIDDVLHDDDIVSPRTQRKIDNAIESTQEVMHDAQEKTGQLLQDAKKKSQFVLDEVETWWDHLTENETVRKTVAFVDENKIPIGIGLTTLAVGTAAYKALSSDSSETDNHDGDDDDDAEPDSKPSMLSTAAAGLFGLSQGALTAALVNFAKENINHADADELWDQKLPAFVKEYITKEQFGSIFHTIKQQLSKEVDDKVTDIKDKGSDLKDKVKDAITDKAQDVKKDAKNTVESAKNAVQDKAKDVKKAVQDKAQDIKKDAKNTVESAKNAVQDKAKDVKKAAHDKAQDLKKDAKDAVHDISSNKDAKTEILETVKQTFKGSDMHFSDFSTALLTVAPIAAMIPLQQFCKNHDIDIKQILSQLSTETRNWVENGKLDDPTNREAWEHAGTPLDLIHNITESVSLYKNKLGLEQQYSRVVQQTEELWDELVDVLQDATLVNLNKEQHTLLTQLQNDFTTLKIHTNQFCNTSIGKKYNNVVLSPTNLSKIERKSITWPDFDHIKTAAIDTFSSDHKGQHNDITIPQLVADQATIYRDLNKFIKSFDASDVKDHVIAPVLNKLKEISNHDQNDNMFTTLLDTFSSSNKSPDNKSTSDKKQRQQSMLASIRNDANANATASHSILFLNSSASDTDLSDDEYYHQHYNEHLLHHDASLTDDDDSSQSFGYSYSPSASIASSNSFSESDNDSDDRFSLAMFDTDNFSIHSTF